MNVVFRKAKRADAAQIARLQELYIDLPWSETQVKEEIENGGAVFFVAEADRVIGFLSGVIAADECEISDIAVDEAYRRRGIAAELFALLTAAAAERGVRKLYLLVREDNIAAAALYGKLGFSAVGRRTKYYNDKDAVIMRKNI